MHDPANGLRRIYIPRTRMNREQSFAVHPRFMAVRYTAINAALGRGGRRAGSCP